MNSGQFILPHPTLILGVGIPASGKSTLFKKIAEAVYDLMYVDKDTINQAFLWTPKDGRRNGDKRGEILRYLPKNIIPPHHENYRYFVEHVLFQSYHCMLMMAKQNLVIGKHPLLEGNYTKELGYGYVENVIFPQFQDVDYRLKIVLAHASSETIRQRCIKRAAERDKFKLIDDKSWEQMLRDQPIIPPDIEKYQHIKVDTTDEVSAQRLKEIIKFLQEE